MQHADSVGWNWQAAIRALFLFAFAIGILHLIRNGNIQLYIHPRFTTFTFCAACAMLLMGLAQLWRFLDARVRRAVVTARYLPFLAPLFLALAVPTTTLGADLAARQGMNLTNRGLVLATGRQSSQPADLWATSRRLSAAEQGAGQLVLMVPGQPPQTVSTPPVADHVKTPPPPPLVNGNVVLGQQTFAPWLLAIYANPTAYIGKTVDLTGFVFRPQGLGPDQFVLARLIVTCHVAHALPDGFLIDWPGSAALHSDSWYQLEGVFALDHYQGKEVIGIRVKRLIPVAKPHDPYIFASA